MDNEHPQPEFEKNKTQLRALQQYETLLKSLASMFRTDLTREMLRIYIAALMEHSPEKIQQAVTHGVKTWRFFPSVAEIFIAIDECAANPEGHERSYRKLVAQYEEAYLSGWTPPQLKSTGEDDVKQVAGEDLSRIHKPRQLSAQEFEARIRELERQKEELLRQQKPEGKA